MAKQSPGACWDRFEYIACICYTGYQDRQESLSKELERVGLLSRTHFFWDFSSPYTEWLAMRANHSKYYQKMFPVGYNNYRAIKTCYELGYKSILVIEDDIRFLKDISLAESAIQDIPKDYEIAMLDKNFPTDVGKMFIQKNEAAERFTGIKWCHFLKMHSSGCYSLSRSGMEKFITVYERDGRRGCLKNNDQYFNKEVFDSGKMYAAFPNIAIQSLCGDGVSLSPLEEYWMLNEHQGGYMSMYNTDCPIITKNNFLKELYVAADRSIQKSGQVDIKKVKPIFCSLPSELSKGIRCTTDADSFSVDIKNTKYKAVTIWGNGRIDANIKALQIAVRDNCPILLCEDGFIRSGTTWVDKSAPEVLRRAHSVIFDVSAYYFDATRISTVERMLNDRSLVITEDQKLEARRLINKIVASKITKYNHQPIYTPKVGREGVRKVLVVDQSYGDFSISRGLASDDTFAKMLDAAQKENHDADILVKTHPDTLAGKKGEKKGYYQDLVEQGNIYKITFPINPYSLMDVCDKVYVCSSGMGLEALLAGKEVHTFGMPFYAGWGLTIDALHLDRRTNKRTLEELFYIFYCMYTHWVDPDMGKETTIDAVINKMIAMRSHKYGTPNPKKIVVPSRAIYAPETRQITSGNTIIFKKAGTTYRRGRRRRLA